MMSGQFPYSGMEGVPAMPSEHSALRSPVRAAERTVPAAVIVVLLPLVVALVGGMWSGLVRLGLDIPAATRFLAVNHGALMVSGVVGTVIGLERAVAMGRMPAYAGPLLSAAGALALVVVPSSDVAPVLFLVSAVAVVLLFLAFLRRQFAMPLAVMTVGVACWAAGNLVWLVEGWTPRSIVPWWIAFLALTIAGERLELTRFMPLRRPARASLWGAVVVLLVAPALVVAVAEGAGLRLLGLGIVVLGLWLVRNDTARRTFRRGGVASYAGVALLAAYGWLTVSGLALVAWALERGLHYDTTLHAFFLGFVFGAIFAHAPIILPAITGLTVRFTPLFTIGLTALHGSLAIRLGANVLEHAGGRQAGGVLNVIAILLLAAALVVGLVLGRRRPNDG